MFTNKHANTQIPEILGAARAWEVTGEVRYRKLVEAFWTCVVTDRGYVATGAVC
ncbi:beta-L-arabinofuranosidase domain-containing protein [Paenibacillus sp. TC-CSREp1]|uniref:beta-L-arabinofuranosidase domain-containing protein n=1 Tax=Paenibacillus sp. TC-CSREp1 TaxID=3410089 RepID=UPI003CEDA717